MRRAISIVLTLSFILVSVTGLLMDDESGREPAPATGGTTATDASGDDSEAEDAEEEPDDDERSAASELHETFAYLLILSGLLHAILNRQALLRHFGLAVRRRAPARPADEVQS